MPFVGAPRVGTFGGNRADGDDGRFREQLAFQSTFFREEDIP